MCSLTPSVTSPQYATLTRTPGIQDADTKRPRLGDSLPEQSVTFLRLVRQVPILLHERAMEQSSYVFETKIAHSMCYVLPLLFPVLCPVATRRVANSAHSKFAPLYGDFVNGTFRMTYSVYDHQGLAFTERHKCVIHSFV